MLQPQRGAVIGGQQHVEGAVVDLRIELAGGAERQHCAMAGVAGERRGDPLHRRSEIGGDRDPHVVCAGNQRQTEQQGGA